MTHHTDLRGAEALADDAHAELVRAVQDLRGPSAAEMAGSQTVRNALIEFIVATRRNDPLSRLSRILAAEVGIVARGPLVRALLLRLQADARIPAGSSQPLPSAVAGTDELDEDDMTPERGSPVVALEKDVRAFPSEPTTNKPVKGPWPWKR